MQEFKEFLKRDFVVVIAGAAALISCAFVPVTDYIEYIDTDVIGILFSLMLIIAGLRGNGVLSAVTDSIVRRAHIEGTRKALLVMSLLTFFLSMFVTNDAALIALVPVTAALFADYPSLLIYAVVVQTVAANMGSMATPFGNPQNLMVFSVYEVSAGEFFASSLPAAGVSLVIIVLLCVFSANKPFISECEKGTVQNKRYIALYGVLFAVVLLSVFGVFDVLVAFASVCVVVIIIEPKRFTEIDYGLLLTFVFFFVFVGNIQQIPKVSEFVSEFVTGREFVSSLLASQVISNVPAAVMLSGFTDNWRAVMLGTDIGGLGTPIASLASLISLRIYGSTENAKSLKFLGVFLIVNVFMLLLLIPFGLYLTSV
jgi:Na+/H+ antiporter NhaD/arsenite permease-like protein